MYFSTRSVDRFDRRDAWQEAIGSHCGAFVMEARSADFDASIEVRGTASLRCSRVMQSPGRAYRTRREIDLRPIPNYLVIMQIAGAGLMEQAGRVAALTPGDLTLIDLARPSCFSFDRKSVQLSLHIPRALFGNDDRGEELECAVKMSAPARHLIGPMVRSTFEHLQSAHPCLSAVRDAIVSFILAMRSGDQATPDHDGEWEASATLKAIQNYVMNHLDAELSPVEIARANNISERSLHRLFQSYGIGLSEWVRQNRLDRCALDLLDPRLRDSSITKIAFSWGFNNSAHFSRVFRAQFAQTPRQYRARTGVVQSH